MESFELDELKFQRHFKKVRKSIKFQLRIALWPGISCIKTDKGLNYGLK